MKIALVSLNQIWENKEKNIIQCKHYIEEAASLKCDLIIFPEMTLTGFSITNSKCYQESRKNSKTISFFINQSKINKIGIVFGYVESGNKNPFNKLIFVNKKGDIIGDYSKIHPFSYANEDRFFEGGTKFEYAFFIKTTFGLSVCYDLRFPEMFQILSSKSEIIINIANWPHKRIKHWFALLKARAIENQVYMIGVNRTGEDGNKLFYSESSLVVSPNGDILEEQKIINLMKIYKIDTEYVSYIREYFPVKKDRKTSLYKNNL